MPVRVSCPYCNTAFALPDVPPAGRAVCPRCGDWFKLHGRMEVTAEPAPATLNPPAPKRWTWVAVAAAIGIAGLGAVLGVYFLQGDSPPGPTGDPPPAVAATPPAQLRGLGYLPAGANVVFAVEVGPVAAHADRIKQDPRWLLEQIGMPIPVLALLQRINLPIRGIDHVVGGAWVPDTDLSDLRVALAVVMRRPLADVPNALRTLDAKPAATGDKKSYRITVAGVPLVLATVSDTVWVFGWSERDLEPAWEGGKTALASGVRELLTERLPPDAAAWAVAADARWADKKPVSFLVGQFGQKDWLPLLAQGRAAAVGVTYGADVPRLRASVRCADAPTADRLRVYFREKATDPGTSAGGEGDWATLDTAADPRDGFTTLKRVLADVGK